MSEIFNLPDWPRAHGGPLLRGQLKTVPEDFVVDEQLGFEPGGSGDHTWIRIEKRGANTDWVSARIAELAGAWPHEVGYAGKKDRHAVTRQWFSVALQGRPEPDWHRLDNEEIRVLEISRDDEKLHPGDHRSNQFSIRLRNIQGDAEGCGRILAAMAEQGFPNYFGEQRFGRDNANLGKARQWFEQGLSPKRSERGMLLSAVRSYLFNQVLAKRVEMNNWNRPLAGDLMIADDSGHSFPVFRLTDEIVVKCQSQAISPSGPLYGTGEPKPSREAGALETEVLQQEEFWLKGLEKQRMRADRRSLRAMAKDLDWVFEGNDLVLNFELAAGSFATALLQEVVLRDLS